MPLAKIAPQFGKELTVEDDGIDDPMIRVTDLQTGQWLELDFDNAEEDSVDNLIRNFKSVYAQLTPVDDDYGDEFDESLATRIVDVLLENDIEGFLSDFSKGEERPGGRPLSPTPTGKKIERAVELDGYKLYVWKTNERREYYGTGPASFYLGYRLVSPEGKIIFDGSGYHPGSGYRGVVDDNTILNLLQALFNSSDDDTPDQQELVNSELAGDFLMAFDGIDDLEGRQPPWRDLMGH